MAKHRIEQRYENPATKESIVIEGTLEHPEESIEVIRRLIVDGAITPDDVEWDADVNFSGVIRPQFVHDSFNVIVYG
jgi:hypothetical protein